MGLKGLAGFVDKDGTLIGTMNYELSHSYSLRGLVSEKSKNTESMQKTEKMIALYKDWGFPGADITIIRRCIKAFADSAWDTIMDSFGYNEECRWYITDPNFDYPATKQYQKSLAHSEQCFKELMQCVAEQNGFDKLIRLEPGDREIFEEICWRYAFHRNITVEQAVSFLEYYLSCRVKGMKTLDEKDREVLLLKSEIERIKSEIRQLESEIRRLERGCVDPGKSIYDQMRESRLEYFAKYAPERIDEMKTQMENEKKENEEQIKRKQNEEQIKRKQYEEQIKQKQEQIEQIITENDGMYASALQLLLYGTRDIEQEIRKLEKINE